MKAIELVGYVDDNHQLRAEVPHEIAPGPVKVIVEVDEEDPAAWGQSAITLWAAEWSDPREDIYSLEDGEPSHGER